MTLFAQEVMTPIKLSGSLAKMFGRDHQRLVGSSGEVIKALCVTIPGFEQYLMTAKQRGLTFAVFKNKRNVGKDELELASGGQEIRIVPVIIGSKRGGLFQTILGVALIGMATFMSGGLAVAFGAGGVWGWCNGNDGRIHGPWRRYPNAITAAEWVSHEAITRQQAKLCIRRPG